MYRRAARMYSNVDLDSAPPAELLDRLYLRLERDVRDAMAAIEKRDIKSKAEAIGHAARIVTELEAALDFEMAPDLCKNLAALYHFLEDRLMTASRELATEPLEQCLGVVAELRDAFGEARRMAA